MYFWTGNAVSLPLSTNAGGQFISVNDPDTRILVVHTNDAFPFASIFCLPHLSESIVLVVATVFLFTQEHLSVKHTPTGS